MLTKKNWRAPFSMEISVCHKVFIGECLYFIIETEIEYPKDELHNCYRHTDSLVETAVVLA